MVNRRLPRLAVCVLLLAVGLSLLPAVGVAQTAGPTTEALFAELRTRMAGHTPTHRELCRYNAAADARGGGFTLDLATVAAGYACDADMVVLGLATTRAFSPAEVDFAEWFLDTDGNARTGCFGGDAVAAVLSTGTGGLGATLFESRDPGTPCDAALWTFRGEMALGGHGQGGFLAVAFPAAYLGNAESLRFFAVLQAAADPDGVYDQAPESSYLSLDLVPPAPGPVAPPDPDPLDEEGLDQPRTCFAPDEEAEDVELATGDATSLCVLLTDEFTILWLSPATFTDPFPSVDPAADNRAGVAIWNDPATHITWHLDVDPVRNRPDHDYDLHLRKVADTTRFQVEVTAVGDAAEPDVACQTLLSGPLHESGEYVAAVTSECFREDGISTPGSVSVGATFQLQHWAPAEDAPDGPLVAGTLTTDRMPDNGLYGPVFKELNPTRGPDASAVFDGDVRTVERFDVTDPVSAAVRVSQLRWLAFDEPDPAEPDPDEPEPDSDDSERRRAAYAVLARDDVFADALAGSALTDGPLLFVQQAQIPDGTIAEIERTLVHGSVVYLLGGEAAIAPTVVERLQALGYEVVRLAGPTRIETSVAVADEVRRRGADGSRVLLARAFGPADDPTAAWADSVAAGVWAGVAGIPVLHTTSDVLAPATAAALQRYGTTRTHLLGGPAALSAAVEQAVPGPQRVAGATRAGTAAAIAGQLPSSGPLLVVNGYDARGWSMALAVSGLAVDLQAPVLLADDAQLPPETAAVVAQRCTEVLAVGSTAFVGPGVVDQLAALRTGC